MANTLRAILQQRLDLYTGPAFSIMLRDWMVKALGPNSFASLSLQLYSFFSSWVLFPFQTPELSQFPFDCGRMNISLSFPSSVLSIV